MALVDVGPLLHKMLDAAMIGAMFGWFSTLALGRIGNALWNVVMMAIVALEWLIYIKDANVGSAFWTNTLSGEQILSTNTLPNSARCTLTSSKSLVGPFGLFEDLNWTAVIYSWARRMYTWLSCRSAFMLLN